MRSRARAPFQHTPTAILTVFIHDVRVIVVVSVLVAIKVTLIVAFRNFRKLTHSGVLIGQKRHILCFDWVIRLKIIFVGRSL